MSKMSVTFRPGISFSFIVLEKKHVAEFSAARDPVTGSWGLKQETLEDTCLLFFSSEQEALSYVLARIPRELIPRS